ncbi:MAG: hypothetical protein D6744_03750 [Planctomycetota bacterium]|nr:MAG: hypothetical protein D6744_03750 [Planctomycetota bacterium]
MITRALLVVGLAGAVTTVAADDSFPWEHDFETARAIAQATGRPIMIDFWATWCGPCKIMNAKTFPDPRVIEKSAAVVPLKQDVDNEGKQLAERYGITAYPTILFIDAEGKVQDKIIGAVPAGPFAEKLDGVSYNELVQAKMVLRKAPDNGEANARIAAAYAMRGEFESAAAAMDKARAAGYQGGYLARANLNAGDYHLRRGKLDEALSAFRKADHPRYDDAIRAYAKLRMLELYQRQKDASRAERTAKSLLRLKDAPEPFLRRAREVLKESE